MGFIGNELFAADFEPMPDDIAVPELAGTKTTDAPAEVSNELAPNLADNAAAEPALA